MEYSLPGLIPIMSFEIGGHAARTGMYQMIWGGVFERFPQLKLAYAEMMGRWWVRTLHDMDDAHYGLPRSMGVTEARNPLTGNLPNPPSYYATNNIFIGYTCIANFEAREVIENDYVDNVMWGRDYPHPEGAYQYPTYDGEESWCRKSLVDSFQNLPLDAIARMAGENAIRMHRLDEAKLRDIAESIDAPTLGELTTPTGFEPDHSLPETPFWFTFRRTGAFN
jgi:hypothetical protein